jgi:hypothetical protein
MVKRPEFRLWDLKEKKMRISFDPTSPDCPNIYLTSLGNLVGMRDSDTGTEFVDIENRMILMSWTGYKDADGKKIFEGDIIKRDGQDVVVAKSLQYFYSQLLPWFSNFVDTENRISTIKVKGNIYETPKLLQPPTAMYGDTEYELEEVTSDSLGVYKEVGNIKTDENFGTYLVRNMQGMVQRCMTKTQLEQALKKLGGEE